MRVLNLLFLTLVLLFINQNKAQAALSAYVANTGANSVSAQTSLEMPQSERITA